MEGGKTRVMRQARCNEVGHRSLEAATVDSRWSGWMLGAGAPPSLPHPPAPPTTLVVPCACARKHRLPNIASSPPLRPPFPLHATLRARA
jgi:hypothetical protein